MASLFNLARMTTATVGIGTITLGSAVPPWLTFAQAGVVDGSTVSYAIQDGAANSEIGTGVYTASGTTLTRTVTKSTNSNSAISLSGTAQVYISVRAEDLREKLTADRTYYVRTDGSDSNTGLANTSGGAFLTIAQAMTAIASIDCTTFQATVSVQAGTWSVAIVLPKVLGSLAPILSGVGSTTLISTAGTCITADNAGSWVINNIKLTSSGSIGLLATNGSAVSVGTGVEWGSFSTYGILATYYASVNLNGTHTISGGMQYFAIANSASITFSATTTLTGTPAFSGAFVLANRLSLMLAGNATGGSYSGAATGVRYSSVLNSVIDTSGSGATFFPGNSAGSTATGGQYA